jgi:formylglycine-generating enzyme required for sulfatase activity
MSLAKSYAAPALGMGLAFSTFVTIAQPVNFNTDVKPILEMNCVSCHNAQHAAENGNYRMDTKSDAFKAHRKDQRIVPGHPDDSLAYSMTVLPLTDDDHMPPKQRPPLTKEESETLRRWIAEGANWPEDVTLKTVMKVDYTRDVEPILEKGEPYSEKDQETLRLWHEQGSHRPEGTAVAHVNKQLALVEEIHQKILANSPEQTEEAMHAYTNIIPGTKVTYAMVPLPSGEFTMGSPPTEAKRNPDEGPQHKVKIDSFWMEKCEVTWNEYELFMYPDETKPVAPTDGTTNYTSALSDAVTRPSKPYVEMSFGMGKDGYPAISMTQHACNIYCQWLSAKTGHFYRLPTEAEWEYACRAGTTTAYYFGDDPKDLGDYAWFVDNSDSKYQKVGKKKPNPWGLYDMIGNVDQWCLDQYDPSYYEKFKDTVATEPWNIATKPYPHVVRGGSWQDDADKLRSACRRGSSPDWKMQDPQLPKSIWYHTDAQFVGFRIIRPLKIPTTEEMYKYWHSGVEKD